jgi:anti-sigma-K factor RskA
MARELSASDVHALAGAYALDALTELERAAFGRHLADCESCTLEVAELSETATRLADLAATAPPPRLRESVMAEIGRTPQTGGRRRGDEARAQAAPVARWRQWTATSVAAGIIAAGAGVATWAVTEQQVRDERSRAEQVTRLLGAPDARLHTADVDGGQVTVVTSASRDAAVAVLSGLPAPGAGKAYQLWFIKPGAYRSAAVLPAGEGTATVRIGPVGDADTFGVSLERKGGSASGQPTNVRRTLPLR